MKRKTSIQEIADKLGISRNTVSKALNNHSNIAQNTKQAILQKAVELGYNNVKHPLLTGELPTFKRTGNVVAVTHEHFMDTSYWSIVSRGVVDALSEAGYNLVFNYVKAADEAGLTVAQNISRENVDGMIVLGALQAGYIHTLLDLGLPAVFVDAALDLAGSGDWRDTVLMENIESVTQITRHLIEKGHRKLGFIGDIRSCKSYYERFWGFQKALSEAGLGDGRCYSFTAQVAQRYQRQEEIDAALEQMEQLPTAFVCANDRTAIFVIKFLKAKGIKIPDEIAVAGFDDIFEAVVVEPHLTTVQIFKEEIGRRAVEQLFWRLKNPNRPVESVYLATQVVFRDSTG